MVVRVMVVVVSDAGVEGGLMRHPRNCRRFFCLEDKLL